MMAISLAMIVLGFIGTFFGNVIKAAISRQRERLADASGVQFTRNPFGLAGALKRIGGEELGSQLQAPNAAEVSHFLFAEGVWKTMAGLRSSHPPLDERIRELDPSWDGKYPAHDSADRQIAQELHSPYQRSHFSPPAASDAGQDNAGMVSGLMEMPVHVVDKAITHVGNPTMAHVDYAAALRPLIPTEIINAARDPYAARAIVFCLLLNKDAAIRSAQLQTLNEIVTPDMVAFVQKAIPFIDQLDVRVRLPLVDIAVPALAAMTRIQFNTFIAAFEKLALADGQFDLFEWVLAQVVTYQLRPHFEPNAASAVRYRSLDPLADQCAVVLSAVAYGGNSDEVAEQAFSTAARFTKLNLKLQPREAASLPDLRKALFAIAQAPPSDRGDLVDTCADAITADGHATLEEVEMLRGISALLGCPMPPLLVDQV